jgi:transmembrane sensor
MNPISDQDIDGLAKNYRSDFQPDVEAGLARLKGRMTSKAAIRPLRPRRWLGIAASLLVLVAAGSFAFQAFFGSTTVRNDDPSPMHFALADGTEIWLQEDSEIRYDRSFNESDRKVSLRGQAYFDVHSDPSRPFLVNSGNAELRVTGTTFNLRV